MTRASGRHGRASLVLVVLALLLLLAAGCGDNDENAQAPRGGGGAASGTGGGADRSAIRIAVNPWTGSAVNANVAKIILERELHTKVQLVNIDEYAQFPALASGDLDASLEVWPSGHAADIARYIEGRRGGPLRDGGVVNGGRLGVVGNIGWWVPSYMLARQPELASWRGIKGNEQLFKTSKSGSAGQFLGSDPSYVSYDAEIIKSLGLNLKVIDSGSEEATLSALDSAYKRRDPLLFYFWTPHWAQEKYDLTEVKLPPFDQHCADAAKKHKGAGYDCDYAPDVLFKAFWLGLQHKSSDAYRFLSNFHYTNDDQQQIAYQIDAKGLSPADAAQRWVDTHGAVWRAWLPQ
jgi:glycine betaine/proline transport system substrate-binding protein